MTDDEPTVEDVAQEVQLLRAKFRQLSEDFNDLRREVNDLENKVDRRT